MGSEDGESGEKPVHKVRITKPFYMAKYETTQAQYEALIGKNRSHFRGDSNPVEEVSWNDAMAFCKQLSSRTGVQVVLPTEAQWEYACRAGTSTTYSFGDSSDKLGDYAWYGSNSESKTHGVGGKKPNRWDLYDLHGNVWEWCMDRKRSYRSSSVVDPGMSKPGLLSKLFGGSRVLRGGSWLNFPSFVRSANRFDVDPDYSFNYIGFRVLLCVSSR